MQLVPDLKPVELLMSGVLVGGIVMFGILPASLIELSAETVSRMLRVIAERLS
jgi:NADH-quinone oxidoreductase subunit M